MDYFNDLLDSYNKLKKRTFKLTFLSEADSKTKPKKKEGEKFEETADEGPAMEFFNSADPQHDPIKYQNLMASKEPYAYRKKHVFSDESKAQAKASSLGSSVVEKDGKFTVAGQISITGGPLGKDQSSKPSSSWEELKSIDPLNATKLINFFAGHSMEQEANDAQFVEETLSKIGGYFELYGKVKPTAKTIEDLKKTREYARDFCSSNSSTQKTDTKLKTFCGNLDRYILGKETRGFEYKLANAVGFSVIDPEAGTSKQLPQISAGTIEQVTASHKFLISFLTETNKDKCEQVTKRIGQTKGKRLVLFGNESTEGIAITPNSLQDLALEKVEEDCGITYEDLNKIVGDGFSNNEKNAVKGTMYESIMAFTARMYAATKLGDKSKKKEAVSELAKIIIEKKGVLEAIFNSMDEEAGRDLSSEFAYQIQEETMEMLSTMPKLREGLEREMRSTWGVIGFMDADDINETGKVVKTGGREDLEFVYSDKSKAQAKASAIGSSVVEKDGKFTVGVGLKRLGSLKSAKFGEINSTQRMVGFILDEIDDKHVEKGFSGSMASTQFGSKSSPARQKALYSYTNSLESKVQKNTDNFIKDKVYTNSNEKIKSQTPASVLKNIAGNITSLLSVPQLEKSLLHTALFDKNEKGENILKNFNGEDGSENRERAREVIGRASRFSQLKKDIESCTEGNCPAKDYLMKSLLVCGSNTRDMGQVIVDDSGKSIVVKHNEIFKILSEANNSGTLEYSFNEGGSSVKVTDPKTGVAVTYRQEGTPAGKDRRETRSLVLVPKDTLTNKKVSGEIKSSANENINFSEYLKGHQALLEKFLGEPFNNSIVE